VGETRKYNERRGEGKEDGTKARGEVRRVEAKTGVD
jgi:hypothetical protein